MYSNKNSLLKKHNQSEKLEYVEEFSPPKIRREDAHVESSPKPQDINSIKLHITIRLEGQEAVVPVKINRACKVIDVKEKAMGKSKKYHQNRK